MLGGIYNIYYDPFSERSMEGIAEVIQIIKEDNMFYHCRVEFVVDNLICNRKILKKENMDPLWFH